MSTIVFKVLYNDFTAKFGPFGCNECGGNPPHTPICEDEKHALLLPKCNDFVICWNHISSLYSQVKAIPKYVQFIAFYGPKVVPGILEYYPNYI